MGMRKIWFLNHYAVPSNYPGITRHFDFGVELVRRGYKVTIFTSSFDHTSKTYISNFQDRYKEEIVKGVKFLWIKTYPSYNGNNWRRMANMLSYTYEVTRAGLELEEKPDVIIGSSLHLFAGLAAYFLAKRKGAKFVFEVRDLWPQTMVDLGSYKRHHPAVWMMYKLEKFLYTKANKIIVIPPRAKDYISNLGVSNDKIIHVPNGICVEEGSDNDSQSLPTELEDEIKKLQSMGKFIVAYTGNHGVANNLEAIMHAARILLDSGYDNIHFLLVGNGVQKEKLVKEAKEFKLTNVSFFNPVLKRQIPRLLSKVDATIILLKETGLFEKYGASPNKLFDYMMAAKPIISVSVFRDIIEKVNCGKVLPDTKPESILKAVLELSRLSLREREEMGIRGRKYVVENHSVSVLVDKLIEAFI